MLEPEGGYQIFKLKELFTISSSKKKFNASDIKFGGKYPYVARGTSNNGIKGYVDLDTRYLNPANTISFGQDTATMYYQKDAYFTGDKIKIFSFTKKTLDERLALYLIACMRHAFRLFIWGAQSFDEKVLGNVEISLPVTASKNIDFDFINSRMRELEESRMRELQSYLIEAGLEDFVLTPDESEALQIINENNIGWKEYKLTDLFSATPGNVDIQNKDVNGKGTYFINSGVTNFGIKGRTDRHAKIFPSNTITIDFFGNAYYRPYEYKLATHNHVFSFKGDAIRDEYVGLFLQSCMQFLTKKYSYGNMATIPLLMNESIMLPVDDKGVINFSVMKSFIRAIQKNTIAKLYAFIEREHSAYVCVMKALK